VYEVPAELQLSESTLRSLAETASALRPSTSAVVGFESASQFVARLGFSALSAQLLGQSALAADAASYSPESERWKVSELEAGIYRLSLAAMQHHVVGFFDVHKMDSSCCERLLKVCEEPPAPSTICWSAPSMDLLAANMRSRISRVVRLELEVAPDIGPWLASLGLSQRLATDERCSDVVALLRGAPSASGLARFATTNAAADAAAYIAHASATAAEIGLTEKHEVRRWCSRMVELLLVDSEWRRTDAYHTGEGCEPTEEYVRAAQSLHEAIRVQAPLGAHLARFFARR
jgi:hypothetical protein